MKKLLTLIILLTITVNTVIPCTNILVTKGASQDGAVMLAYTVDSPGHYYPFFFALAKTHKKGEMFKILEWTSDKYLGEIPEVPNTYKVVEHMNEHQVVITETTCGARKELDVANGIIDYGNLIYLGLLRSKTAKEAIEVMTSLDAAYGWGSREPESFYISDKNEAWILEMISKGAGEKGCVWVAMRVPDGMICAHANKLRIRNFPLNDKANCLYSADVISFAEKKGYYNKQRDGEFDFIKTYAPDDPTALMACEGRVWRVLSLAAPSQNFSSDYFRAVKGAKPYPLFIKPDKKLSARDVISITRDRFEGCEYDYSKLLVSTTYNTAILNRPLVWNYINAKDTVKCIWPRAISVPQAAFVFVSQSRDLPNELGVQWFAADDPKTSVFFPIYTSITSVPKCLANGNEKNPDLTSAHWLFNAVANYSYFYNYYKILPDLMKVQQSLEDDFFAKQQSVEADALKLLKESPSKAADYLTNYTNSQSDRVMKDWNKLFMNILFKYRDGNINDSTGLRASAKGMGYPNEILKKAYQERPEFYELKWKEK